MLAPGECHATMSGDNISKIKRISYGNALKQYQDERQYFSDRFHEYFVLSFIAISKIPYYLSSMMHAAILEHWCFLPVSRWNHCSV